MRNQYLRKILDLKAKRAQHLQNAAAANDGGEIETYDKEMAEAKKLKDEIDRLQAVVDQMGDEPTTSAPQVAVPTDTGAGADVRASREYARAFAWAVTNGVNPRNARSVGGDQVGLLMNALTETGGDPEGSKGGFLVPVDMETRIRELRRSMVALSNLFHRESVTTSTGWRPVDTAPAEGFTLMGEMSQIPNAEEPKFRRVDYTIKKYGGFIPVSNDLLEDNTAGLLEYLARWFAKKGVLTENTLLLGLLNKLAPTAAAAGEELETLKTVLNATLDPAIAQSAQIITNQNGFNYLDLLVDGHDRPLLQPDPTQPTRKLFAGHAVTVLSNAQLKNAAGGAPVYIGDFDQYGTLFVRKGLEVQSTAVGGDAWRTDSTEIRGIARYDAQVMDTEAAAMVTLAEA